MRLIVGIFCAVTATVIIAGCSSTARDPELAEYYAEKNRAYAQSQRPSMRPVRNVTDRPRILEH